MQANEHSKIKGIAARAGTGAPPTARRRSSAGSPSWSSHSFDRHRRSAQKTLDRRRLLHRRVGQRRARRSTDAGLEAAGRRVGAGPEQAALTVDDPQFQAAVADVTQARRPLPDVTNVQSPYAPRRPVSKDGHSALVEFDITRRRRARPRTRSTRCWRRSTAAQQAHPDLRIEQFGDASADKALERRVREGPPEGRDAVAAAHAGDPAGRVRRAGGGGLPLLLALSAVLATIGLVALPSHVFPIDDASASVILLIGMAVGVDYSLFYMRREREERAAGHDAADRARSARPRPPAARSSSPA